MNILINKKIFCRHHPARSKNKAINTKEYLIYTPNPSSNKAAGAIDNRRQSTITKIDLARILRTLQ
jgi:hypothetical protein